MDNLMENCTLDQIDGNYTLEKLVWTILWKRGGGGGSTGQIRGC